MTDFCPRYYELKKKYDNIQEIRRRKRLSKEFKAYLLKMEQYTLAEMRELEEVRERIEREDKEERERICSVLKIFIKNWDSLNPTDMRDPLNKIMKLDEWLKSRFDINDFCHFPEALLDLKEEYVSLKREDFREWTLKKFVECYKEFLCIELRKVCLYEQQKNCAYVRDKITATRLGEYSPFTEDMLFSHFVDIAIDEDIYEDGLPEILENDDTPNYLRPKCILRNFGKF